MKRAGVLTLSDKGSSGQRQDLSGPVIIEILTGLGLSVELSAIIPDDLTLIKEQLISWCDEQSLDLIVTTGGTGLSPRDVTPDATPWS
jgi:molybdenum cofactor synthesis domain-containing protein